MVLAAPGPLLTPPPSSSPPKTRGPHRSYSAQTRSQNEEKNLPPKPYLPLQTRTRHRLSHRPHVPMLMRGTPPTIRSPPHQSRPTKNPSKQAHPVLKYRVPHGSQSAWWLDLAPATVEFWVRFPNERNQGKQAHPVLKYRVPHESQSRLVHTGLGSSSLISHVLHSPPPPTRTAL